MAVRGALWRQVQQANPDLSAVQVDALVDRATHQERDLVLRHHLNLDQARELVREELFPPRPQRLVPNLPKTPA